METSSPDRTLISLEHVSLILLPLSVAFALAVERRPTLGAWQAQMATGATSVAFVIVALVKLYSTASTTGVSFQAVNWADEAVTVATGALAFGLIGIRV